MLTKTKKKMAGLVLLGGVISACSTAIPNQEQTNILVRDNWLIGHCASNGWVKDMQVVAAYQMAIEEKMINATPESLAAANAELKRLLKAGKPGPKQCRNMELYAHKVAGWRAESKAEKEAFQKSMEDFSDSVNTNPRYANCTTYAGITNCVSY